MSAHGGKLSSYTFLWGPGSSKGVDDTPEAPAECMCGESRLLSIALDSHGGGTTYRQARERRSWYTSYVSVTTE